MSCACIRIQVEIELAPSNATKPATLYDVGRCRTGLPFSGWRRPPDHQSRSGRQPHCPPCPCLQPPPATIGSVLIESRGPQAELAEPRAAARLVEVPITFDRPFSFWRSAPNHPTSGALLLDQSPSSPRLRGGAAVTIALCLSLCKDTGRHAASPKLILLAGQSIHRGPGR